MLFLEARKSILKERKETSSSSQPSPSDPPKPPQTPPIEITNSQEVEEKLDDPDSALDAGNTKTPEDEIEQKDVWMDLDDFFESFRLACR